MISIKELLKKNNIRAHRYQKKGNIVIVEDDTKKYVIKKRNHNKDIYDYLDNRNFDYYPSIIDSNDDYDMYPYIEDIDIPKEQKIADLIPFVALLHAKTTYHKSIDESDYKQLYEDISNNIVYLKDYYNDLITLIEEKILFSPSEILLANNISLIFERLDFCEHQKDKWYKNISNHNKIRVAVVHNNLSPDHFLQNDKKYLISWDKAKIDLPIFDLYRLYLNSYKYVDFVQMLKLYEKSYPLKEEEKMLLVILISMPQKIEMNYSNYQNCIAIKNEIKRLLSSRELEKMIKSIK